MEFVSADRIAHFYPDVGAFQGARVARVLEVIEKRGAKHKQKYRKRRSRVAIPSYLAYLLKIDASQRA
jgi:hypothetical protein